MSDQWDEFSKSVAEQLPRRESLRRFGAIFVGTVFAPAGLEAAKPAADRCKAFCKCRNKTQQQQCLAACNECNRETHRLSGSCGSYTCCGAGQTTCGGYCADLSNDFYNCGSCGDVCDDPDAYETGACIDGNCEYWCVEGATNCNGRCAPLDQDYENCGACGNFCTGSTPYCNNGVCSQCPPHLVACGSICTNLSNDNANCGACGNVCGGSTPYCTEGVCGQCPPGSVISGGSCIDLLWDSNNCGAIGNRCEPQSVCSFGVCEGVYYPY